MRSTQALIYRKNLIHNINEIKRQLKNPATKICVSVKADGYGCGAITTAQAAVECGVTHLAVATVDEGSELRDAGIKCDVLLYSPFAFDEIEDVFRLDLSPFVFDEEIVEKLQAESQKPKAKSQKLKVHLAVDTGMGRVGCDPKDAATLAKKIVLSENLELAGMCTHFAVSDSTTTDDVAYTKKQFAIFCDAIQNVRDSGLNPGLCHCAASAGLLAFPEMQMDMVRPGIITYGYYPDKINREYLESVGRHCDLRPVMALKTNVASVREFDAGKSVSYGRTWTAQQKTKIAILPVGYADGLLRRSSPGLEVAIGGKKYPVRGRICMDQCMVEVDGSVKRGDEVLIFGPKESGALQTAQEIADATNTISYEVMTSISERVPRVIVR